MRITKSTEDGGTKIKARHVVWGHHDRVKHLMFYPTPTMQPQSVSILLFLAAIQHFHIYTSVFWQGYLQVAEPGTREAFVTKPVPEFDLDQSKRFKLLKLLYGLCGSGDMWHGTLCKRNLNNLGMKPLRSDPALCILRNKGPPKVL